MNRELQTYSLVLAVALTPCAFGSAGIVAPPAPPAVLGANKALDGFVPRVLARDLPLLARLLSLDAEQKPIVELLIADVESAGGSQQVLQEFRDSLSAVLGDEQRGRLGDAFEAIFRERMESGGGIGGEAVDIAALARIALRGEQDASVDAVVVAYRRDLYRLLNARAAVESEGGAEGGEPLLRARIEIRTLNEQGTELIAAKLGADAAADFRKRVLARGYPSAMAPSFGLASLERLLAERIEDEAIRALVSEGRVRFAEICAKGVAAVRARDDAPTRGHAAVEDAARSIAAAERAYDEFESWILRRTSESVSSEVLQATREGQAILARHKANAQGADTPWQDSAEVVRKFDKNNDGAIDGDESTAALDAFVRSVGRQQRRRL